MLSIQNLRAKVDDKPILNGVNLNINQGEVHAIMGPMAWKKHPGPILAGRDDHEVTDGEIIYKGQNLWSLSPRNGRGQGSSSHPIPRRDSAKNIYLLKAAVNAIREHRGLPELKAGDFLKLVREKLKIMQMDEAFLHRNVNEGFSGGEKKRTRFCRCSYLSQP